MMWVFSASGSGLGLLGVIPRWSQARYHANMHRVAISQGLAYATYVTSHDWMYCMRQSERPSDDNAPMTVEPQAAQRYP